ncbi:MAG: KpsF/GutQ family sugar-phosphate isomerase [Bacteriovoracaceae bacterium]
MDYQKIMSQVLMTEANALKLAGERITQKVGEQLVHLFEQLTQTGGNLIISGVGKSGLIGQKIAATFSSLGHPSFFLHPTEAMHGDLGRVTRADAIVLISKSGTTEELLSMLPYVNIPQERIVAIVGNTHSPIAKRAGIILDGFVEKEACINDLAPTTSTTLALALGDAMAVLYESVLGVSKEKFAINHPAGLLGKSLSLTVRQLMIDVSECPIVSPQATLQDAILAMTKMPIGMCAIIEGDKFEGILVEGDIRRAFSKASDAMTKSITEFMTKNPIEVSADALAFDALKVMENPKKQITVVPVTQDNKFVGVLRLHDLFKAGFNSSLATTK